MLQLIDYSPIITITVIIDNYWLIMIIKCVISYMASV